MGIVALVRARADILIVGAGLACWIAGALYAPARPASPFVVEDMRVPSHGARVMLAATVLRPRGDGPFGLLVLNHGVPLTAAARGRESPALLRAAATVFAARGYAVMMPLRRGFGATGGAFAEDAGSCARPDYARAERAAAADILAAYALARRLPYVDPERIILAGQSAGAVAALRAAAERPRGLVAVLAFAAGRGGNPLLHPGVPCATERVAEVFAQLGRRVEVPVLLHYTQNDLFFGPAASRTWFSRFKAAGGKAHYVLQPPFKHDGHYVFSDGAGSRVWLPEVDAFLRRHGIWRSERDSNPRYGFKPV